MSVWVSMTASQLPKKLRWKSKIDQASHNLSKWTHLSKKSHSSSTNWTTIRPLPRSIRNLWMSNESLKRKLKPLWSRIGPRKLLLTTSQKLQHPSYLTNQASFNTGCPWHRALKLKSKSKNIRISNRQMSSHFNQKLQRRMTRAPLK